jgi:hypothetical protein
MDQLWQNFQQWIFSVSLLRPQKHSILSQKLWPQKLIVKSIQIQKLVDTENLNKS